LPITVYLDTQDYSRFGDVLRGKGDSDTERQFNSLESLKQSGDVIFALSMPLLGELFQYHPDYRETTLRKAEAVERLCGGWALAYPSRLVAAEIVREFQNSNDIDLATDVAVLSPDRFWYPKVTNSFEDIRTKMQESVRSELAGMPLNRKLRRGAAKQARKLNFGDIAQEAAPELAAKFDLPIEVISTSIVAFLRGTLTAEQANRRLFESIAEPVKFVELYFEKLDTDRSLPNWMSKFGSDFQARLTEIQKLLQPLAREKSTHAEIEKMLSDSGRTLGQSVVKLGISDTPEFGLSSELSTELANDPLFVARIPAYEIIGSLIPAYVRQILGLSGSTAKIERSFGGDLVHALYLPHVDIWRGDHRVTTLLKKSVPRYANKIQPTIEDLLIAINDRRSFRPTLDPIPLTP
jgi:hypothetical protein